MSWSYAIILLIISVQHAFCTSPVIVKRFCNKTTDETFNTGCRSCGVPYQCPANWKLEFGSSCPLHSGWLSPQRRFPWHMRGCRYVCKRTVNVPVCCPGFWGSSCTACPGLNEVSMACYGNGKCNDGLQNNGTCHCNETFEGSGCEKCTDKTKYGNKCQKNCTCVKGDCFSGFVGHGKCLPYTCQIGYHGENCEIHEPECQKKCAIANSHCVVASNISISCHCNPGYRKKASQCHAINPCVDDKNICGVNKICHYESPGRHSCSCAEHFTGDGTVCTQIDYCQTNNGNCSMINSKCVMGNPGEVKCVCLAGYQNYTKNNGCSLIDLCKTTKVKCGLNADCYMVKPLLHSCRCRQGYVIGQPNGTDCYGNVIRRLDSLNNGLYKDRFTNVRTFIKRHTSLFRPFEANGPFTCFFPFDTGLLPTLTKQQQYLLASNSELAQAVLLRHVVSGEILSTKFENGKMTTLKGHDVFIKKIDGSTYYYQLDGGTTQAKIVSSDHIASNGVIHVLQTAAWLPNFKTYMYTSSLTMWQVIQQNPKFKTLVYLIKIAKLRSMFEVTDNSLTLFAPDDEAFAKLDSEHMKFLNSSKDVVKLHTILRHHILLEKIGIAELITRRRISTSVPDSITVIVKDRGAVFLSNKAKLIDTDIPTKSGVVHQINHVLLPSSVLPLFKNWCMKENGVFWSRCKSCLRRHTCPAGSRKNNKRRRCHSFATGVLRGCQVGCTRVSKRCCDGFYGYSCISCAGPVNNPCNGNGKCFDGKYGDGTCACNRGFDGIDCGACENKSMYGKYCNMSCTCVHGTCDNGLYSSGACVTGSCITGYQGGNCSIRLIPCGKQKIPCHINGACYMKPTPRCICNSGYDGDGQNCYEIDPCSLPNRGGCANNSLCTKTAPGKNKCVCINGWTGDGYRYCQPINPCRSSNGGCHKYAHCIYSGPAQSQCKCLDGYTGNGYYCNEINNCLIQNGGCSPYARCKKTAPGKNSCECRHLYVGDGYICSASISLRMSRHKNVSAFYLYLKMTNLINILDNMKNITVFAPSDSAIRKLNNTQLQVLRNPKNLEAYLRSNTAPNFYNSGMLKNLSEIPSTFRGHPITITKRNGEIYINNVAKVITSDLAASNGIFHIIDKVDLHPLLPPSSHDNLYNTVCNDQDLAEMCSFLKKFDLENALKNTTRYYTIFAPTSTSFNTLSVEEHKAINNITIRYHITEHFLEKSSITKSQQFDSMAGPYYTLTVKKENDTLFVNGIATTHVKTGVSWLIYKTNKILKARQNVCFKGDIIQDGLPCPAGYKFESLKYCSIDRFYGISCKIKCVVKDKRECCPGFWGAYCDACPGTNNNPCFGNGQCNEMLSGNGQCSCKNGFTGIACEKCKEGHYGKDCKPCDCLNNAQCNPKSGDCLCPLKWKGLRCEKNATVEKCGGVTCHQHASCRNTTDGSRCQCDYGFTGNGADCTHFDPCSIKPCSIYADCKAAKNLTAICTCKPNYVGDGIYCKGINPCRIPPDKCHPKAHCLYSIPGHYVCQCGPGFIGDGIKRCDKYDPCSQYDKCNVNAVCSYNETNLFISCKCHPGYQGDGYACTGGDLTEMLQQNPDLSKFNKLIQDSVYQYLLGNENIFTVFAPNNEALEDVKRKRRSTHASLTTDVQSYIVPCVQISDYDLKRKSASFRSASGHWINITSPSTINNRINIISVDTTINGTLIVIDDLLKSDDDQQSTANMSFIDVIKTKGYSKFYDLLKLASMLNVISLRYFQPYTIFLPTNEAINALPEDLKQRLFSGNYTSELQSILKYHVLSKQKINVTDIFSTTGGLLRRTDQGASMYLSCEAKKGDLYVNDEIQIIERGIKFQEGVAFGISRVLLPVGVAGRCDEIKYKNIQIPCKYCNTAKACPLGSYVKTVENNPSCYVHSPVLSDTISGCSYKCIQRKMTRKCCKNFYGYDCQECPGGATYPCNGKGFCNDGITGNGTCICYDNQHVGTACEKCYDQVSCGVISNICKDPRRNPCSVHATCDNSDKKQSLCKCRPGYHGDGFYCQENDLCQNTTASGCHPNARCIYQAPNSVKCRCRSGYFGNGQQCIAYPATHVCANNNGNCHYHADCKERDGSVVCQCRDGFVGNGFFCGGTIMNIIYDVEDLSEFAKVFRRLAYGVDGNDLIRALNSEMSYIVFAPLNYGFTVKTLNINEIKTYIVPGFRDNFHVGVKETLFTVANTEIIVDTSKSGVSKVNFVAKIVGQYQATNGIIYLIDHILPIIDLPTTPFPSTPPHESTTKSAPGAEANIKHAHNDKSTIIGAVVGGIIGLAIIVIIVVIIFVRKHRRQPGVRYNKQFHSILFQSDVYDDNEEDEDYENQELQHPSSSFAEETSASNPNFEEQHEEQLGDQIEMMETSSTVPLTASDAITFG